MSTLGTPTRRTVRRPSPRRGWFGARPPRKAGRGRTLAIAGGVALVLLVAAILLQESMPRRAAVNERLSLTDASALLPKDVTLAPQAMVEIPDLPQPSYVLGYVRGEVPVAAFVRWDREAGGYEPG